MALTFPADCKTPGEKAEYAHIVEETFKLYHNHLGKWRREGFSQAEFNALPMEVKAFMPYKAKLEQSEWLKLQDWWEEKNEAVVTMLHGAKRECRQSAKWQPDAKTLISDIGAVSIG